MSLLRNSWRQLTSMRTALVLLFLLAVAAIPGSVLPQRPLGPEPVAAYYAKHPDLAPVIDRLSGFDVYRSPWFSAIYLLLFISLVGCVLPRLRDHARALLRKPPSVPANLQRLPHYASFSAGSRRVAPRSEGRARHSDTANETLSDVTLALRGWRRLVRTQPGSLEVSAERGYIKETGNLFFHAALVCLLVGVVVGSYYGWHANRLVVTGADMSFCNTPQQLDEYLPGDRVTPADLPKFCLELADFEASYLESGAPSSFSATAKVTGDQTLTETFSVNHPLRLDGASVYLLGHGYAPILRYTDKFGRVQTSVAPFGPQKDMTSEGVVAFPDANVDPKSTGGRTSDQQVAFSGLYLPTAPATPPYVRTLFPAERNPLLVLQFYRGDLGIDSGIPSSVYQLNQRQISNGKLKLVDSKFLKPGDAWKLDDGSTVEFLGTRQYAAISIRHDPGEAIVLGSASVLLVGLMLSLGGKRRRVFVRVTPDPIDPERSLIEVGGLPRSDYPGFPDEFQAIVTSLRDKTGASACLPSPTAS